MNGRIFKVDHNDFPVSESQALNNIIGPPIVVSSPIRVIMYSKDFAGHGDPRRINAPRHSQERDVVLKTQTRPPKMWNDRRPKTSPTVGLASLEKDAPVPSWGNCFMGQTGSVDPKA